MKQRYRVGESDIDVDLGSESEFSTGKAVHLSTKESDLTFSQEWYAKGFHVESLFNAQEFSSLKTGVENTAKSLLESSGAHVQGFSLEKYHQFVDEKLHFEVVSRTRDMFPQDFSFDCESVYQRLGEMLGFPLGDVGPGGKKMHIIVRINRPFSGDFNPVHKDVYEAYDGRGEIPQFVNFWIPICGVSTASSLPVAKGSHLLSEEAIVRTSAGSTINGKSYRVNSIVSWDGSSELERPEVPYQSVLVFSPHLIHGLAINQQEDITRVSLEFRLFRA